MLDQVMAWGGALRSLWAPLAGQWMHLTMGRVHMNASDDRPGSVTGTDHVRGDQHAPVTIIEYGDFECPSCKQAAPAVLLLTHRFQGGVRLVFRHFPLEEFHANALAAAEASEASATQGRFWDMHDRLFDNQRDLQSTQLRRLADELGLDLQRFSIELETHVHVPRIRQDIAEGRRVGIRATPTFYVNGALCDVSFSLLALRRAVELALCLSRSNSTLLPRAYPAVGARDT